MKSPAGKLAEHNKALRKALNELKEAFIRLVNTRGDPTKLTEAIEKLNEFRQLVNNAEGIGFIVGIDKFTIVVFPLTGDPAKDLEQMNLNLPKNEMN